MSGTTKYQYLPREFVSVEALIQVVYNSALAFTFCFDLESLKVSQKWQPRAFLGLHEHVHSLCMCWPSGFPEINQDFFKALRDNAFPSLFYQAFSLIHCFLPQVLSPLAAATKIFAHKYYKKHCLCSSSSTRQVLNQVYRQKFLCFSKKPSNSSNNQLFAYGALSTL